MEYIKKNDKSLNLDSCEKKPLLSIMVAVYNAEDYLEKCIDSIINQTYNNIEIILINDGSSDNSASICEDYKKKDKRVVVIHKENKGLSDTRNIGLKIAKGDFLGFVDSDDWILPNMYERLFDLIIKYDADISQCEYFTNIKEVPENFNMNINVLEKTEYMPLILTDEISSQIWKNLYKRELLKNIHFPKNYSVQDMMVFHLIANKARKIVKTNEKLYYYFATREGNISNNKKGLFKGTMCRAIAFSDRYTFSLNLYPQVKDILLKKSIRFIIASFCRANKNDMKLYKEEMENLEVFLHNNKSEIFSSKELSYIEKASIKMFLFNKNLFINTCRTLNIN